MHSFSTTAKGEICTKETIDRSLTKVLNIQDMGYREILNNLTLKQKQVLQAIAREGKAQAINSGTFIRKYNLPSASSVQSAVKPLIDKEIVYRDNDVYTVYDKFFAHWLIREN